MNSGDWRGNLVAGTTMSVYVEKRLGVNSDPRKPAVPVLPEEAKNLTDCSFFRHGRMGLIYRMEKRPNWETAALKSKGIYSARKSCNFCHE